MSLWKIAWRNVEQRALASILTALSMALGVALVVAVLVIYGVVHDSFSRAAQGYHLIVGAKGGRLQLVLNTVFHLSQPIENIPWSYYQEFTDGRFKSSTKVVVPYCLGDNFRGYRVVGTVPGMFESLEYAPGRQYAFQPGGRNFDSGHFFEAVIGSVVANKTGLQVGDYFEPTHGVTTEEGQGLKHEGFQVVGILEPTGTPNDRALFVNLEGFFLLEGHAKPVDNTPDAQTAATDETDETDEAEVTEQQSATETTNDEPAPSDQPAPLPENQREVTALLVLAASDITAQGLYGAINKGPVAQAAYPAREVTELFQGIVGNLQWLLLVLAVLVVVVAGIGIMVSIYNSMSDRYHDIAIMRALGASRGTVMIVILLESVLLSLGGGVLGVLLGHGVIGLASPWIEGETGVTIGFLQFEWNELILIPGLILLASLAGYVPAMAAYRTDVAKALSASP